MDVSDSDDDVRLAYSYRVMVWEMYGLSQRHPDGSNPSQRGSARPSQKSQSARPRINPDKVRNGHRKVSKEDS
jgi:hypothetical protein